MYWSRTGSPLDVLAFGAMIGLAWLAGWLIVSHHFRLRSQERLAAGLGAGLVLWIVVSNLLAHALPLALAFWGAAVLLLLAGLLGAWRSGRRPWLDWGDLRAWPQVLALGLLVVFFARIQQGLAIFDDYLHLPLVSVMGAGDIPPHFYLDPKNYLAYHYGLQVFAAGMVRVGGLFPWSAWDLSKAIAIALTLLLGWLWVRRVTGNQVAAYLGSFLITFAGGARWLLLLLPGGVLNWMNAGVELINTGASSAPDFLHSLGRAWAIDGGGVFPFPFIFHSGIFVPVMFSLGSSGALPFIAILLLLLLVERRLSWPGMIWISLIFASLALSAEHLFVALWIGLAIFGLVLWFRKGSRPPLKALLPWAAMLLLTGVLSVVQGAFITEAVRNVLLKLQGIQATQGEYNYFSFALNWPPEMVSAHFGKLSLFKPAQLLALLAELGPALLLAPLATWYAYRKGGRRNWMAAGLGGAALFSILLPLLFRYGVERSSTRLPATALWLWVVLAFPAAWLIFQRAKPWLKALLAGGYMAATLGGLVILAVQMLAMPFPQISYYLNGTDAQFSRLYWDKLPAGAQVFDPEAYRAVALFGRAARANQDFYHPWPEWEALLNNPDPQALAAAGYAYVYMDRDWSKTLTAEQKALLAQPCVKTVKEINPQDKDFRVLLDIRGCR